MLNRIKNRLLNLIAPIPSPDLVGTQNESNRVRWLESILKSIPSGHSILDAGAGEQQFKKFCSHLNYTSQDIAEYTGEGDIGLQTGTWQFGKLDIISDIIDIPRPDSSFDAILCTEVLEHIPDPAKAIIEFSRLLKSEGHLIISAPFCSLTHFAPYHHSSGFSRFYYEEHLSKNNFKIVNITPNGNYFEYLAQEIRRLPKVSKMYSGNVHRYKELLASRILLNSLQESSQNDSSSHELLCFGFHVHAIKN